MAFSSAYSASICTTLSPCPAPASAPSPFYLALGSGKGLITLALIQLGATVGEFILGFLFTRKLYPEMRFSIGHMYRDHVALIFSFGVFALLLQASTYLVYYTDAMVIGAFLPVSMITFFAIAGNLTIYARDLVGGFSRIMTPMASHMEVKTGTAGIRDASLKAARYCAMAILPIFITFIIRGHSFISLWMGSVLRGFVLSRPLDSQASPGSSPPALRFSLPPSSASANTSPSFRLPSPKAFAI